MMKALEGGSLKKTKYYSNGLYEKIVNDLGQTKEINYISGSSGLAAVFIKDFDNTQKMYYVHQDYLGSILALTNENGTVAERYYFDAWGNRKNPNNWSQNDSRTSFILDRGFTGHEHLDHFNLINMNGRVYDASLGSFLSADPVIQAPNYTQDLNLYSYAYGNPLKYTDPSGYFEMSRPDPGDRRTRVSGGAGWFLNSTHIVSRTGPTFYDYMMNNMWGDLQDFVTNSTGDLDLTFNGQNALYDAVSYVYSTTVGVGGILSGNINAEQMDAYDKLYPNKVASSSGGDTFFSINGVTAPWSNETIIEKYNLILKYLDGANQTAGFAVSFAGIAIEDVKFLSQLSTSTFIVGFGIAALRTDFQSPQSITEFGIGGGLSVWAYYVPWAIPFAGAYAAVSIDKEYSKTLPKRAAEGYNLSNQQIRNHPYFKNLDW
ncbi:RHS repeat domain-containing protein [Labilibaculum euxinus]